MKKKQTSTLEPDDDMLEEYDFSVGVLVAAFPDIKLDEAKSALKAHLPTKHQKLIPNNFAAMDKGYAHAKAQSEKVAV